MDTDPLAFSDNFQSSLRTPSLLMTEIISVSKQYQSQLARNLGINSTDLAVLEQVMMTGPQSPSALARRLGLSAAAMTTVVDRLVASENVVRAPHPTDRRGVIVSPTPAAVQRGLDDVMPVMISIDGALNDFDEAQQEIIARYLRRVADLHREHLRD